MNNESSLPYILTILSIFILLFYFALSIHTDYINTWTYEDIEAFDSNWQYVATASWLHTIPSNFNLVSAEITLKLRVSHYSENSLYNPPM